VYIDSWPGKEKKTFAGKKERPFRKAQEKVKRMLKGRISPHKKKEGISESSQFLVLGRAG